MLGAYLPVRCLPQAACDRTDDTIHRDKREWFLKRLERCRRRRCSVLRRAAMRWRWGLFRYDIVRCIFASIDDFEAEPALRQWGNWVSSTLLPGARACARACGS